MRRTKRVICGGLHERVREGDQPVRGGPALLEQVGRHRALERNEHLPELGEPASDGQTAGEAEHGGRAHQPPSVRGARVEAGSHQRGEIGG